MKDLIKKILREDLKYWHASDARPTNDTYKLVSEEDEDIKRLAVFDFDGTLFRTPTRSQYKSKTGEKWSEISWWQNPTSLDTELFDIPSIPSTIRQWKEEINRPNTLVVLLTGRVQGLEPEVLKIINDNNLRFDRHYLNPNKDTLKHKLIVLTKLTKEFPNLEEIVMWDDREEHRQSFENWGASTFLDFKYHFVQ